MIVFEQFSFEFPRREIQIQIVTVMQEKKQLSLIKCFLKVLPSCSCFEQLLFPHSILYTQI